MFPTMIALRQRGWWFLLGRIATLSLISGLLWSGWLLMPQRSSGGWALPGDTYVLALSPDGALLATATRTLHADDSTHVELRRVADGALVRSFALGGTRSLAFSPDGQLLAATALGRGTLLWQLNNGQMLQHFSGGIRSVPFSPDSHFLATSVWNSTTQTGETRVWDVGAGHVQMVWPGACMAFSPDGHALLVGDPAELRRVTDSATLWHLSLGGCAFFSPRGSFIYAAPNDNRGTRLIDPATGQVLRSLPDVFSGMVVSPDERWIARGYQGSAGTFPVITWGDVFGHIEVWRVSDGQHVATLQGHLNGTSEVVWTPDGRRLISAGGDGMIRFWDMPPVDPRWPHGLILLGIGLLLARWGAGRRRGGVAG